ncbi:hypothetical protein TD95_000795 [Thielaviopsis punctulata]|uniref:Uncharacterized protein n=1 Tax=Thielaviopsis punctulata TaxID=72032 RepID=A0A0F4ZLX0_9PEZI|nr:hypothetical protein TD95_000795 [Thielaviopsis punctulata]
MLTSKQQATFGYRKSHDLPTPPATTRHSPPTSYQDSYKVMPHSQRSNSPYAQSIAHDQGLGSMPLPPPSWQGTEDSMKSWLAAKSEEEKRKQEEEKTRQEVLRRDQRQLEFEILKTSLTGGIPPSMIPLIFAGMGGVTLPPSQLEKAQQMAGTLPYHAQPIPTSPSNRRDSQAYSAYPGTPGAATQAHGFVHPGSPAGRNTRAAAVASSGRPLSAINTSASASATYGVSYPTSQQSANSEPQSGGSSIYFHHWQPPSSNAASNSSSQAPAPSGSSSSSSKVKRKRESL